MPKQFRKAVDDALKLFSAGGIGEALASDWDETEHGFIVALADLRALVPSPIDVTYLSKKDKKRFAAIFQKLDSLLTQLKAFTRFEGKSIEDYGITQKEYEDYAAHYHNVIEELRADRDDDGSGSSDMPLNTEYEPLAYSRVKIDYEYIINLIQDIVSNMNDETDEEEFKAKVEEIRGYIKEFSAGNETLGGMMLTILDGVEKDKKAFAGRNISEILSDMKRNAIDAVVDSFVQKWFVDRSAVVFAMENHYNGMIPNASVLKDSLRYAEYKESTNEPLKKPKARSQVIAELQDIIVKEIMPLQIGK